jgi:hypothetical protein
MLRQLLLLSMACVLSGFAQEIHEEESPGSVPRVCVEVRRSGSSFAAFRERSYQWRYVVYFPNLRVIAVGDLFASTPNLDFFHGGSLVGWGPVLGEILKLHFDVVVPSKGPW